MNNHYRLSTEQFNIIQNQIQPKIEEGVIRSVDARRLHQWLGIGKDFSNWIKDHIARAGLVEHEDYEILLAKSGEQVWGGSNRKEYALTPDAAKEIAMMSSGDKGKLIRNYFIDCEKRLKEPEITINSPKSHLFIELARQAEEIERLAVETKQLQIQVVERDEVIETQEYEIEALKTELASIFDRDQWADILTATMLAQLFKQCMSEIKDDVNSVFTPSNQDINLILWKMGLIGTNGGKPNTQSVLHTFNLRYHGVPKITHNTVGYVLPVKFDRSAKTFTKFLLDMKKYGVEHNIGVKRTRGFKFL